MLVSTFSTVFADDEAVTAPETEVVAENTTDVEQTIAEKQAQDNSYKKSDVYLAEKEVTVDYIVDGNLFVCADTVTINSQIGGDAFICAKKIVIEKEGYVFSNLFATAQSIEIKGVVDVIDVFRGDVHPVERSALNELSVRADEEIVMS